MFSSSREPSVAVYPDSGKVQITARGRGGLMLRDEPLDYWDGED